MKSQTFGLGQTNWAYKFWGIWGIFGQTISTHFCTVSPLFMVSIIHPLFLKKTKPLYPHPNEYLGLGFEFELQRIRDLAFVCPQSVLADIEIITSYLGTRWFNKLEAFSNCPFLYMIVPSLGGSSKDMKCVHTINYQNKKSVQCFSHICKQ